MNPKPRLVYVDTSVFGGHFDAAFAKPTEEFFNQVETGNFRILISPLVEDEIEPAPPEVREFFEKFLKAGQTIRISEDALRLQQAYLDAKIVSSKSDSDALHVALATVSGCKLIVSWNFAHIVHFEKIPLYNAVNVLNGYSKILIHSPAEVIGYDKNL